MSEENATPEIRFKGFADPWEQRKLGDLLSESDERSSTQEILSVSVTKGVYPASESDRDSNPGASINNYKVVRNKDIVYNSMRMWQGAVAMSDYNGIVSPAYVVMHPAETIDSKMLSYSLKRPVMLSKFYSASQGNSKDTLTLKYPAFSEIEILLPADLLEQQRISRSLETLDSLITLHQRKYDKLCNIKKSMLDKMFPKDGETVPEIRFKGFADPWEQRKLGDLFTYERPDAYITNEDQLSDDGPTPVLTANKGFILGYTNETRVHDNPCIIFDDFTLDCKLVDFPFMVRSSALKILHVKPGINLRFAYELLNSTQIEILGHARHYISVVQPTEILLPNGKEQQRIGSLFENLDSLITLHQRKQFQERKDINELTVKQASALRLLRRMDQGLQAGGNSRSNYAEVPAFIVVA